MEATTPPHEDENTAEEINSSRLNYLSNIAFTELSAAISDILQEDTDWDKAYDYASKASAEAKEYRWAAFFTAGMTARRVIFKVLGRAASVGSDEDVKYLKQLFSADREAENGIRDAFYVVSSFNYAEEPIDTSWSWYSSSECSEMRYQGAVMAFIFMIASKVKDIARFSDLPEQEIWEGLAAGV